MPTLKKDSKPPSPTVEPFPELGPGWSLRTVTRGDGKRRDNYWISPGGKRTFRSRREVDRYLAAIGNDDESQSEGDDKEAAAAAPGPKVSNRRARGKGKSAEDDGNNAAVAAGGGGSRATRKGKPAARSSKTKRKVTRSSARFKKKKGLQGTKSRKASSHRPCNTHAAKWLRWLDRLKKYRDEKGSLKRVMSDDLPLAQWIAIQRRLYRRRQKGEKSTMTDERVAALESLGFDWNPWETGWKEQLEALKQFKATHGHCNVPQRCSEYKQLGNWVNTHREQYRRKQNGEKSAMTDERVAALESLGFDWKFRSDWETHLEDLKQFRANHGHTNVPKDWSKNKQLADWVVHQRAQFTHQLRQQREKSPLIQERIAALESLGFEWDLSGKGKNAEDDCTNVAVANTAAADGDAGNIKGDDGAAAARTLSSPGTTPEGGDRRGGAGNVVVTEVEPTSPRLAEIRAGDSLPKIDGLDVARLTSQEVRSVLSLPAERRFLVLHRKGGRSWSRSWR